ncbi:hypothetical protein [Psychroflexus sp. ALD_RP9]|uniref:hypothetical protein n=1 Tax=Psychroflexus sp. ALD_RP9 TaxID=2777186 RepID=UPI001A8D638B|nr:hypothetical protein [Psychroflexus sp. ALD_RP9]QSS96114.1 hypothetical protein IMZ30_06510 [Psychroflexus sp. ALD_RP9]
MLHTFFSRLLKVLAAILGLLLIGFVVLKLVYNSPVPSGESGPAADDLAQQMLDAMHHEAFSEAKEIHWVFRDTNHYKWYLQKHQVLVSWEDYQVLLQTKTPEQSSAYHQEVVLTGKAKDKAIAYAVKNFNNDSFWLVAPYKVFDPGTKRELVKEAGQQQLLVTYTSGGSTPGDSYLWQLNDQNLPIAMKMWVSIIPFDGLEAQWLNWQMTSGGFLLPEQRQIMGVNIPVSKVKVVP